jgi:acetolactate synthase-1/2/3 large subunit
MKLNGGQMVCESLIREGVDIFFGIPGGAILPLYQTLPEYPQLRHILVRHEQGAAMGADGYARATGRVGVAWATSGPGATNMATGLSCAMMDSIPIVAITGQVSRAAIGSDAFQETDVTGVTLPITKHNYLVMNAAEIPEVMHEAFYLAKSGRPGPVLVDIPKDVFTEIAEFTYPDSINIPGYQPVLEGDPGDVEQAARLIAQAQRPVILSGHGVILSEAYQEVRELAERSEIPVITTFLGLSGFPEDHVLYVGMPGMHGAAYASIAIDEADLLIALGMRFDDRVTGNPRTFAPRAKILHVDIDPAELGKIKRPTVSILGDAKRVLRQLLPLVKPATRPEWLGRIEQLRREHPLAVPESEKLLPQFVLERLSDLTGGRAIVVTGVGQHQMWAGQLYKFMDPNLLISSGGLGAMGYEVPAALGAQLGRPDKTVWSIAGDGGFQMTMMELATMVENHVPVKIAIMNNRCLGMVVQWQRLFYQNSFVATKYTGNPDFVKLAEAYGIPACRVSEKDSVAEAIIWAMETDGPVLVDFWIDTEQDVYPMIPSGMSVAELMEDPKLNRDRVK